MKTILKHVLLAALVLGGKADVAATTGNGAANNIESANSRRLGKRAPRDDSRIPDHGGVDHGPDVRQHHDDNFEHPRPTKRPPKKQPGEGRPFRDMHKRKYQRGDGSLPSHAYDYVIDELEELREQLSSIEQEFGFEAEETQTIMQKVRLLEKIRRNSKMLDNGMPQEEFDEFVAKMTRVSELRLQDRTNGFSASRRRNTTGFSEEDFGKMREAEKAHDEKRKERNKEMQALGKEIRELKDHWRVVPKPMVHEATAEQHTEIMKVYEQIKATTDREEKKKLKKKMEHLQTMIHDNRRHRDMSDEDREAIRALRVKAMEATNEEDQDAHRMAAEKIFREHRKAKRSKRRAERGETEEPMRRFGEDDAELQQLQQQIENAADKDERKAIRQKIRERMKTLRDEERTRRTGMAHPQRPNRPLGGGVRGKGNAEE